MSNTSDQEQRAKEALAKIQAARDADPGEHNPHRVHREWPAATPTEADIEELVKDLDLDKE